jgi:hypothetical protein
MKHLSTFLPAALLLATPALAQNELSNFSATGRGGVINTFAVGYQAIGINPANLGRADGARVAFTIGEVGAGVGSQSLTRTQFDKLIFHSGDVLSAAERTELVNGLTSDNTLQFNADVTAFALSVKLPAGLGGLAFSAHQRLNGRLAFNRNGADIVVNGRNAALIRQYYDAAGNPRSGSTPPQLSAALDGTVMQLAATNEYNVSYGKEIISVPGALKLTAGVGYRYIQGVGVADARFSGSGGLTAYTALSPVFGFSYSPSLQGNPSFNYQNGGELSPVGTGHGFDLGLAAEIGKVVRVGASVTDLGTMNWKGNVLTVNDQQLRYPQYDGTTDYNVVQGIIDQFADDNKSLFTYQPAREYKAKLPAKLRLGGGVRISEYFEAGLDVTVPLNKVAGNLASTFVGAGLDFKPVRWLRLSSGVSGGAGYRASLPVGLTIVTSVWEAGLSTRDVTGYFSEKSPYVSGAFGVLRFKIGKGTS